MFFNSFVQTGSEWIPWSNVITPEAYGAVGDGIADDTIPVQNAISAYNGDGRTVYLSRTYLITSQINVSTSDIVITGYGTLKTTSDLALLKVTSKAKISNLNFVGSGKGASEDADAAHANQHGIFIDGGTGTTIHNIYAQDIAGSAIRVINTAGTSIGVLISSPRIQSCNNAFHVLTSGEYVSVDNAIVSGCNRGAYIQAGNFSWTGGSATYNRSSVWVTSGGNDAHGIINGVMLNHQGAYNLRFDGPINNGFRIVNCYMYGGAIGVNGACTGIRLEKCFLSACEFYLSGIDSSSRLVLDSCIFDVATSNITQAPGLQYNLSMYNCKAIGTDLLINNSCIDENEYIVSASASATPVTFATISPYINTSIEYTIEALITDTSNSEGQTRRASTIKSVVVWNRGSSGAPFIQANGSYPINTGIPRNYSITTSVSGNNIIMQYIGDAAIALKWYIKVTAKQIA